MKLTKAAALILAVSWWPVAAGADQGDVRFSAGLATAGMSLSAFDGQGDALAWGSVVGVGWRPSDAAEIAGEIRYLGRGAVTVDGVRMEGVGGSARSIAARMHDVEAAAALRLIGNDSWLHGTLSRWQPLLGLRAGAFWQSLGSTVVTDDRGREVSAGAGDSKVRPLVGLDAGVRWRASEWWELGLLASGSVAEDRRILALHLEVAWLHWF